MARQASVRYWPGRKGGGYFCVYRGTRYELALGPDDAPTGPTYLAATDRFAEIIRGIEKKEAEEAKPRHATVREVLEAYLKHISKKRKPGTVEIRQRSFAPFANFKPKKEAGLIGEKPAIGLTHLHVYEFLEYMEKPRQQNRKKPQPRRKPLGWTSGSQRNCVVGLIAAFNWAVRCSMIPKNPLTGIDKEPASSRGAEFLIGSNAEEIEKNHLRVLAAAPASYHPIIQALKDTGARPGELIAARGSDFRPAMGAFVFHKELTRKNDQFAHKTSKRERPHHLPHGQDA